MNRYGQGVRFLPAAPVLSDRGNEPQSAAEPKIVVECVAMHSAQRNRPKPRGVGTEVHASRLQQVAVDGRTT